MSSEIKSNVKSFIIENFLFGDESYVLEDNASLIDNDIIDSTAVLELVAFIEDEYKVSVEDNEIVPANMDTIAAISTFVASKTAA